MSVNHVTQKMSEMDITHPSISTKPGFTRVSRTETNTFGSSARAPPRAPPTKAKMGTSGAKTLRSMNSSNTLTTNTNPPGSRPPLAKLQHQPSANSLRMGPPPLTQKVSRSSLKSASSFNAAKVPGPSTASQVGIDIGKYDGGFERENERRGSAVCGEAAEILKLDSSTSA